MGTPGTECVGPAGSSMHQIGGGEGGMNWRPPEVILGEELVRGDFHVGDTVRDQIPEDSVNSVVDLYQKYQGDTEKFPSQGEKWLFLWVVELTLAAGKRVEWRGQRCRRQWS